MEYKVTQFTKLKLSNNVKSNYISVIIPVYNDVVGLRDTLDSLRAQSLDKLQYELIVANDGGDEEITKLCRDYKVKLIEIKPNMGSYYARNRALENSAGEYIAFVDADIKVPANWLENGLTALDIYDYVAGDIKIDKSKIKTLTHLYDYLYAFQVKKCLERTKFGPTGNLFVKRKVFEYVGGFDQRLRSGGDFEFGNRINQYTDFRQGHMSDITVIHPPRGYKEYITKLNRVAKGHHQLSVFYPERFAFLRKRLNYYLGEMIIPSQRVKQVYNEAKTHGLSYMQVFFYCWWMKALESFVKMKYLRIRASDINPKYS